MMTIRRAARVCVVAAFAAAAASAGTGSDAIVLYETNGLLPDDITYGIPIGYAVAADGGVTIVGAEHNVIDGFGRGSAYLFATAAGQQQRLLIDPDPELGNRFGHAVDVEGGVAVIGDHWSVDNNLYAGAAFLFDTATGALRHKLRPSDLDFLDNFGFAVAVSGGRAIIGAPFDDDLGIQSGSAYIFDVDTGQQRFKLLPSDGQDIVQFGTSIAASGDLAVIGAPFGAGSDGSDVGAAYVFDCSTGQELFKLSPQDGTRRDQFGRAVAIDGNLVLVGARSHITNGDRTGAAYLFDTETGQQLFEFLPSELGRQDWFGSAVAISGGLAVVGAEGDSDNGYRSGSAYVFDVTTGRQLYRLFPSDEEESKSFGTSAAVEGGRVVVGAYFQISNGSSGSGSVYVYDLDTCAPSDLNLDGVVDTADLGALISRLGAAGGAADINGDGVVDKADLGKLIGEFGTACP